MLIPWRVYQISTNVGETRDVPRGATGAPVGTKPVGGANGTEGRSRAPKG